MKINQIYSAGKRIRVDI